MEGAESLIAYLPHEEEDAQATKKRVEAYNGKCHLFPTDLTSPENCQKVVDSALSTMGAINILVNNAAFQMVQKDITELPIEQWIKTFNTNIHPFYYLAKYPHMQQRLQEEVREAMTRDTVPNWSTLSTLPLLDGIVNEILRLHPPVASGMPRETPTNGAQLGPYWVPGETIVTVPTYSIQRDERYFAKPNEFIPERWFSQSELVIDRHAWVPFSIGPFNCAGKYFAVMEMKVLIAKAVTAFDIEMAPGEDGKDMMENCKDFMTLWLPDLRLCLKPREKS